MGVRGQRAGPRRGFTLVLVALFCFASLFTSGCVSPSQTPPPSRAPPNQCSGFYLPSRGFGQSDLDQDGKIDTASVGLRFQGRSAESNLTIFVNATLERPPGHVI